MKLRIPVVVTAALALLLAVAAPAGAAGEAFSTEILPDSCQLLRVDIATGVVTEVGPQDQCQMPVFLARAPDGALFGVNGESGLALFRVDVTTGAVTKVGDLGVTSANQATFAALTFDPSGRLWFGINSGDAACDDSAIATCLYSVDPATGQATLVGGMGAVADGLGGLAADCSGVYAATTIGTSTLARVDTTTATATAIGPTGVTPGLQGMAFDTDGALHALGATVGETPFHLWTIDPATGAGTEGPALTGYASNPFDQGGLAMTPPACAPVSPLVPVPVTLAPAFTG